VYVRFVECTGRKVTLRGEFLGFVRASETTCEKVEQQTCRVFIEVLNPGLGNGFQQRNTYIVRRMF
jgi:hypothetical protein